MLPDPRPLPVGTPLKGGGMVAYSDTLTLRYRPWAAPALVSEFKTVISCHSTMLLNGDLICQGSYVARKIGESYEIFCIAEILSNNATRVISSVLIEKVFIGTKVLPYRLPSLSRSGVYSTCQVEVSSLMC